jgi:hypothetical protein
MPGVYVVSVPRSGAILDLAAVVALLLPDEAECRTAEFDRDGTLYMLWTV